MPEKAPLNSSTLTDEEVQSLTTFYQAFTDKNPDLLDQVCTPDWQDIPLVPGQVPGPNGLKDQITSVYLKAFPDLQIVIHEIIGSPGRAGVRASITGTHLGEVHGVAPTGQHVDIALHEFHHLQDGRLTHTWHLEDWFGTLNKLGAWTPLAAAEASSNETQ